MALHNHGKALIFDIHSYPEQALPYEINGDCKRPEICIGTDDFHTTECLTRITCLAFESIGLEVAINSPYSGSIVPSRFYHSDQRVSSIMIEIRRDMYMDQNTGNQTNKFTSFSKILHKALENIASQFLK
jgi:N-formylglutamate amidohydrolase